MLFKMQNPLFLTPNGIGLLLDWWQHIFGELALVVAGRGVVGNNNELVVGDSSCNAQVGS